MCVRVCMCVCVCRTKKVGCSTPSHPHSLNPPTRHPTLHSLHNVREGLSESVHVLPVEVSGGLVQCQQTTVETKGLGKSQTNNDGSQHLVGEEREEGGGGEGERRKDQIVGSYQIIGASQLTTVHAHFQWYIMKGK